MPLSSAKKSIHLWKFRAVAVLLIIALGLQLAPSNASTSPIASSGELLRHRWVEIPLGQLSPGSTVSFELAPTKSSNTFVKLASRDDGYHRPTLIAKSGRRSNSNTPQADAFIDSNTPDKNYATHNRLYIENRPDARSFIKFIVPSVRTTHTEVDYSLRIYSVRASREGFDVYSTSNNWSERGITYENAPVRQSTNTPPPTVPPTTTRATTTTTKPAPTTTSATLPPTTTTRPAPTTTTPPSTDGIEAPRGPSGNFKLHWHDEFDGLILKNHWNPSWLGNSRTTITPPINEYEGSCYDPANVSVRNGELVLKVESRNSSNCRTRNRQAQYASGMVESSGGFRWTYGYAEARVLTPAASNGLYANFPAFWSNGDNWPQDGEIDVFEGIEGYATHNYHHRDGSIGSRDANAASNARAGQYNIYGVLWEPGRLEFYVNGVLQRTVTSSVVSTSHYLILNHGVIESGSDWDWTGSRITPSEMKVDWVRVWKK